MDASVRASRLVDRGTALLAGLLVGAALLQPHPLAPWPAWLALPLVIAASRSPLVLPTGSTEALVIGLDSSLLVLLGLTLPTGQAFVLWAVSIATAELTARRSLDTRLFNAGVCIVAGGVSLLVLSLVPAHERTSGIGLLATVTAATAYFLVDYFWSAVSIGVAEHKPLATLIDPGGLRVALLCFLGVDSLGFLAAVVLRDQSWTIALLVIPFAALLLASRSWSATRVAEQREGALSEAAVAVQDASDPEHVEALLLEHAPRVVRAPEARWLEPEQARDRRGWTGEVLAFSPGGRRGGRALGIARKPSGAPYIAKDLEALGMLIGVAEQASERLRLLAELGRSASSDALTGLANRALFTTSLREDVEGGRRVAVLYVDLDGFKGLNDTRGHAAGDTLLAAAAGRLRAAVRPGDLPARLGGDEFAVLLRDLPGGSPARAAQQAAERVRAALGSPYDVGGVLVRLPASVGLAVRADEPADELLRAADAAMYAAKAAGGDRCQLFGTELLRQRQERTELAAALRSALLDGSGPDGRVVPYYQPLVDAAGEVSGVEALVRWEHPVHGLLLPSAFLDVARESGLMDLLGVAVLRTAAREVGQAAVGCGRTVGLAVNASASQLVGASFLAAVHEVLPTPGVRLTVEVTEDELLDGAAVDAVRALRPLGVRVALDDFGTGWSSLSVLRRLPVDVVKLDKSFVSDLPHDRSATALVRAVLEMAAALGLDSVAEGVEKLPQARVLRELGCSYLQGYLFSRPQPASALPGLLHRPVPATL